MREHLVKLLALSLLSGSLGCTWVKPEEGAEAVALVKPNVVQSCKKLGTTTSKVKDKVAFVNRGDKKVASEVLTLAKNTALEMNGDTLVAETEEQDGKQTFTVYKCRP